MSTKKYIVSPKTGRHITVTGKTYQELIKDPKYKRKAENAKRIVLPALRNKTEKKERVIRFKEVNLDKAPKESIKEVLKRESLSHHAKIVSLKEQMKKENEGRGIKTRGWKSIAPQKFKEREELMKMCGKQCFLMPEQQKFPICPSLREGQKCKCKVSCQGLNAAYIRANEWKYPKVSAVAKKLQEKYKC